MKRFTLILTALCAVVTGYSQDTLLWAGAFLNVELNEAAYVLATDQTVASSTLIIKDKNGNDDQFPFWTETETPNRRIWSGQSYGTNPSFTNDYFIKFAGGHSHPNLYTVMGSNIPTTAGIKYEGANVNGPKELGGLYCGSRTFQGGLRKYVDIFNTDTVYIDELVVTKGAELTHHGPAPLIIRNELVNYGKIVSKVENIYLEADHINGRVATFDNRGAFVGRLKVDMLEGYKSDYSTIGYIWDWFQPMDLQDSIAAIFPYLSEEQADLLQSYVDAGNSPTLQEWNTITTSDAFLNVYQSQVGHALKGMRGGIAWGDMAHKYIWKDHRENIQVDNFAALFGKEDGYNGFSWEQITNGQSFQLAINLSSSVSPDIYPESANDTIILIDDEAFGILNGYQIFEGDTILVSDTLNLLLNDVIFNVTIMEDSWNGRFVNEAFNLAEGEGNYQWHATGKRFPNTYGFGQILPPISMPIHTPFHNIFTGSYGQNQTWTSPNELMYADSVNTFFQLWYDQSYGDPITPWTANSEFADNPAFNYPPNFPNMSWETCFGCSGNNSEQFYGGAFYTLGLDCDAPASWPIAQWRIQLGNQRTEAVKTYRGSPWINSDLAYYENEFAFYKTIPGQAPIPNLQLPTWNEDNMSMGFVMSGKPGLTYVYTPSGNLFVSETWAECLDTNVVLYSDELQTNPDTVTLICESLNQQQAWAPEQVGLISGSLYDWDNYFSAEYNEEVYADFQEISNLNNWELITNPLLGYLDLNEVAETFFEENPDIPSLEFAKYHGDKTVGTITNENLSAFISSELYCDNDDLNFSPVGYPCSETQLFPRSFWRRKYFNYGNIYMSELDFWLNLLVIQYTESAGAGWSDVAVDLAEDFLDGQIDAQDGPIINYLYTADINPNAYFNLGRYLQPGQSVWVKNFGENLRQLNIRAEHGEYDHEFAGTEELWTGNYLGAFGERNGNSQVENIFNNENIVFSIAWKNDTSFYPFHAFNLEWNDEHTDGVTQSEDVEKLDLVVPTVYGDSSAFTPTANIGDNGPHNLDPMQMYIPLPPLDGAWKIMPASFQRNVDASQWLADTDVPNLRMGFQLFDENNEYEIQYLRRWQTADVFENDWTFPMHANVYWTTILADHNGDGVVTTTDLQLLLQAMGASQEDPTYDPAMDANEDGVIGVYEILTWLNEFGYTIFAPDGQWYQADINLIQQGSLTPGAQTELENAILADFPDYTEAGFDYDPTTRVLSIFNSDIVVKNTELKVVAQGRNSVVLPDEDATFIVTTDKTFGYINPNATQVTTAVDPGNYTYNSVTYTAAQGSGMISLYDTDLNGNTVQNWVNMYTNFDVYSGSLSPQPNVSPYINQIYYGWNSNKTDGDLYSPTNALNRGLVDIFGAGIPYDGVFDFTGGVYADPKWETATEGYKNEDGFFARSVMERKNIPLAFVTNRERVELYERPIVLDKEVTLGHKYPGGLSQTFGKYSYLSRTYDPGETAWSNGDAKDHFDAQLHQGVITTADMMTIRDYFRFKLAGVSPKFGVRNNNPGSLIDFEESFGLTPNYNAVYGEPQQTPDKFWAPNKCSNYTEWTNNIVAPFFAVHMGQAVSVSIEPAPTGQTGEITNAGQGHYDYFANAPMNTVLGSYGPLVYDFDWDGTWTQNDLDIWNGITAYWSSLGDDSPTGEYAPAHYYRAGTDALNTIVNVLPDYATNPDKYQPADRFDDYWDLSTDAKIDTLIANWANCFNGYEYVIGNTVLGPYKIGVDFVGSVDVPLTLQSTLDIATQR
jgi:hypothetical protein